MKIFSLNDTVLCAPSMSIEGSDALRKGFPCFYARSALEVPNKPYEQALVSTARWDLGVPCICILSHGYVGQIFPASEDHTYFSILLHLYGNVPDLGVELC